MILWGALAALLSFVHSAVAQQCLWSAPGLVARWRGENDLTDQSGFAHHGSGQGISYSSTSNGSIPLDDLVAYYPLDGNAQDASDSLLHGQVVGATATVDRFGNPAGAMPL